MILEPRPGRYRLHHLDSPEAEAVLAKQGVSRADLDRELAELERSEGIRVRSIVGVHVLASGRPAAQLVLADRSQADCAIAVRAITRVFPDLEVRPVTNLAEAESVLAYTRLATALVASGLDDRTWLQTIRWFVRKRRGIVVAMLEDCDHRHRQEALEAGASYVWSKSELLIAQLRHELAARLGCAAPERPRLLG